MPELPEVETIKNEISPFVLGRKFVGVEILDPRLIRKPLVEEFKNLISGQEVKEVERRGKYLIFSLSSGQYLIFHFKMTGRFLLMRDEYTRAIFIFDNGSKLFFSARGSREGVGDIWLVKNKEELVGKLGPEPLSPQFSPEILAQILKNRSAPIKTLLINQHLIAGIGNMYADEILFVARIHPQKKAKELSAIEIERLFKAISEVLTTAIENKGATVRDYKLPDGKPGRAQLRFKVVRKGGKPCSICSTSIERIEVGGRITYFCPKCQPLATTFG